MSGTIVKASGALMPTMRVFGSYALVYLFDGTGLYMDETGRRQRLVAGDIVLVFPSLGHRYGPEAGDTWSEFYLAFEGPVFELWERTGLLRPSQPIRHLEPIDYWLAQFESVLGAPRKSGFAPPLLEVCRLQQVLAEALVGGPRSGSQQAQLRWASRACTLLQADLKQDLDLRALAREMGTSYASFRKRFTRIVGMPPARYRATRIISRACELMQRGELSDKQIAGELGFCDAFHFSRRFKQIVGCSPRSFRRQQPWVL